MEISLTDRRNSRPRHGGTWGFTPRSSLLEDTLSATSPPSRQGAAQHRDVPQRGRPTTRRSLPARRSFRPCRMPAWRGISTAPDGYCRAVRGLPPEADTPRSTSSHRWRARLSDPFVDWQYTADRLRVAATWWWTTCRSDGIFSPTSWTLTTWTRVLRTERFSVHQRSGNHRRPQLDRQPYSRRAPGSEPRSNSSWNRRTGRFERAMARVLPWRLMQKPLLARFVGPT